ncbi:PqiC family protein [Acetobacter persici]|uniref:PqiC family protein n=1 Tax=Acetobacter persici TaxID=1076596 RepID=UPI001BA6386C|nr:PqiC family protein [Acetobacter persici]MBS0963935.1 membrane integrity-associated transporter subunit PqiC [Acetobacter persici]
MTFSPSSRRLQAALPRRSLLLGAAGLGVMATTLTACSSGAGPTLYTLSVVPGQPAPGGPRFVEVRQPTIASGLDRDRIVTADSGYKLTVSANDAWGDSLAGQISRTLAGDLAQRLPGTSVFAENDAVSTEPQAYVELSVTRFSAGPSGAVQIEAALSVKGAQAGAPDTSGQFYMQRVLVQAPAVSSGTMAMVEALSQLLGQLADQAAAQLRMMPPEPPESSPVPASAAGSRHRK